MKFENFNNLPNSTENDKHLKDDSSIGVNAILVRRPAFVVDKDGSCTASAYTLGAGGFWPLFGGITLRYVDTTIVTQECLPIPPIHVIAIIQLPSSRYAKRIACRTSAQLFFPNAYSDPAQAILPPHKQSN